MNWKQILNTKLVMAILLLPFLEPLGIEEMANYLRGGWTVLHQIFIILKLISFVVIAVFSIYQLGRPTIIFVYMLIFQVWIMLMTIINGGYSFSRLITSLTSIGVVLLFDYYVRIGNTKKFISVAETILMVIIVINLITVIAYPNGMYVNDRNWSLNWLLGYKNLHIQYYLPFISICAINQNLKKGKLGVKLYAMLAVIIVSTYFSQSITSLISVSLIGLLTILFGSSELPEKINMTSIYIVSTALSILMIFMGFQNYFGEFLQNVLGKDVSMSSRTLIWSKGMNYFLQHPFLGNGIVSISYAIGHRNYSVNQMHNMYFDILVVGGIVLLAIYTVIVILVNKKVSECRSLFLKKITLFVFAGYAVLFITEARRNLALFNMFMFLSYYLPTIVKQYNLEEYEMKKLRIRIKFGREI